MTTTTTQSPVAQKAASAGYGLATGESDWDRLDTMHNGINYFLDNKLTPAPLENTRRIIRAWVRTILVTFRNLVVHLSCRISTGSGAWALQAARQFPNAVVIGGDIHPFPLRPVPANFKFQQLDLRQPLPFEPGSFDVVHIRFVLCHLPHGHTLIPRLADLVSPGGWLLIDDVDMPGPVEGDVPALKQAMDAFHRYMDSDNQSTRMGSALEPALRDSDQFAEVNVQKTNMPMNVPLPDPRWKVLSDTMRDSMTRAYLGKVAPGVRAFGLTEEAQQELVKELSGTVPWTAEAFQYFTWSRKL